MIMRLNAELALLLLGLACMPGCAREQQLPRYGAMPAFSLQNQHGRTVTQRELHGRVVVVDFIFTACPDVCPLLTEQLQALRKQLPQDAALTLVSFSVDPEHDTPERLQRFAVQHGAAQRNWWFLTGPIDEVKQVVTRGFKQAMQAQPTAAGQPANVLHGTHFVLVDAAGEIRGFYPSDEDGRIALRSAVSSLLADKGTS
jgi:protein SCO1/2